MTSTAWVLINGPEAEIHLPPGVKVQVKVKSSSKSEQHVTLRDKSGAVRLEFSGSGENQIIGEATVNTSENYQLDAVFAYAVADDIRNPSKGLNSGGPYEIGNYNLMVVVAENGDDNDYNDAILEFSWYTK